MSDIKARPRGRGAGRSGRGGFSNRGGRGSSSRQTNGTVTDVTDISNVEDEDDDFAELKSKHAQKIGPIKEMFPDWTEQDIAYALEENDGDLEGTVERISEGYLFHTHFICHCSDY